MVSVIIPLFNKEQAIRNTLQSVLCQTYKDLEVVVVDDGSTDGSTAIAKEMADKDARIKYFRKLNGGVSSARNYGLHKSQGEWIVFLDADDEMLPCNLEYLLDIAKRFNVSIAAANFVVSLGEGKIRESKIKISKATRFGNFFKALVYRQGTFCPGATIYRRDQLGKKPYNENFSRYEDLEFELRIIKNNPVAFSPKVVAVIHNEYSGLSNPRNDYIEKDFIFNMDFSNKSFWQKVHMGRFIKEGCYTYPKGKSLLKEKYHLNYYWQYAYLFFKRFYGGLYKIKRNFKKNRIRILVL